MLVGNAFSTKATLRRALRDGKSVTIELDELVTKQNLQHFRNVGQGEKMSAITGKTRVESVKEEVCQRMRRRQRRHLRFTQEYHVNCRW